MRLVDCGSGETHHCRNKVGHCEYMAGLDGWLFVFVGVGVNQLMSGGVCMI